MAPRDWLAVAALAFSVLCWTGIGLVFYFITWPFMRDTRKAAVDGLELAVKNAAAMGTLGQLLEEGRGALAAWKEKTASIDGARLERLCAAAERVLAAGGSPFGAAAVPKAPPAADVVGLRGELRGCRTKCGHDILVAAELDRCPVCGILL